MPVVTYTSDLTTDLLDDAKSTQHNNGKKKRRRKNKKKFTISKDNVQSQLEITDLTSDVVQTELAVRIPNTTGQDKICKAGDLELNDQKDDVGHCELNDQNVDAGHCELNDQNIDTGHYELNDQNVDAGHCEFNDQNVNAGHCELNDQNVDAGHCELNDQKDDCNQEICLLYKDQKIRKFEQEAPSELSSHCSSLSPISDDTPINPASITPEASSPCDKESCTKEKTSISSVEMRYLTFPEFRQPLDNEYVHIYHEDFYSCKLDIRDEFVGKLLGKKGKCVQAIKRETGVTVAIDEVLRDGYKACYLKGPKSNVVAAIAKIRKVFPRNEFPAIQSMLNQVELVQISPQERITVDIGHDSEEKQYVNVTGISTVNEIYVQLLGHRDYHNLRPMLIRLNAIYNSFTVPAIPFPCSVGSLCVGLINQTWQRCKVVRCNVEDNNVLVILEDAGCQLLVNSCQLRLALKSMIKIPAMATPVFLQGIQVLDDAYTVAAGNQWLSETVSKYRMFITVVGRDYCTEKAIVHLWGVNQGNYVKLINHHLVYLNFAHDCENNIVCKHRRPEQIQEDIHYF